MMKELDTDEVYLYAGKGSDAEISRFAEGTPFGPYVAIEVEDAESVASTLAHSPDTAARLALALLARMVEEDEAAPAYSTAMRALEHFIKHEEARRDFKIGEEVEVFDPNIDYGWYKVTVLEYSRHGGYLVQTFGTSVDFYSPAHIRKVEQVD